MQLAFDAGRRAEADEARARAPEGSASARTGRSSSSAAASTAPSRARPSRSRSSSPATRSRSPGSASARASRARSSATTSLAARAATARTTSARRARSAPRRRRRASSRASRWRAGWAASASPQLGLTVHEVDVEKNLLLVKGAVPGPKNGLVEVRGMSRAKAPRRCSRATGKKSKDISLDEAVFGAEVKPHLVHEAVRAEQNAHRAGTFATKSRGLVSGGRAKPWRQKGTGRARRHDPRAAVHRRRSRVRQGAAQLRPEGQPQGRSAGAAVRARRARAGRDARRSSTADAFDEPSTKQAAQRARGAGRSAVPLVVVPRRGGGPREVVPQPAAGRGRRAVASSRSAPSSGRARCSSARPRSQLVTGRAG